MVKSERRVKTVRGRVIGKRKVREGKRDTKSGRDPALRS